MHNSVLQYYKAVWRNACLVDDDIAVLYTQLKKKREETEKSWDCRCQISWTVVVDEKRKSKNEDDEDFNPVLAVWRSEADRVEYSYTSNERVSQSVKFGWSEANMKSRERARPELIKFTFSNIKVISEVVVYAETFPSSIHNNFVLNLFLVYIYFFFSLSSPSPLHFSSFKFCKFVEFSCLLASLPFSFIVTTTTQWHNHISQFTVLQLPLSRRAIQDVKTTTTTAQLEHATRRHIHMKAMNVEGKIWNFLCIFFFSLPVPEETVSRRRLSNERNKINFYRE